MKTADTLAKSFHHCWLMHMAYVRSPPAVDVTQPSSDCMLLNLQNEHSATCFL